MNKAVHWFLTGLGLCVLAGVVFALHPRDGAAGAANAAGRSSLAATFDVKDEPIRPIPLSVALDERKVALGEMLFNDPRLSRDDTVACVACHDQNIRQKGGFLCMFRDQFI